MYATICPLSTLADIKIYTVMNRFRNRYLVGAAISLPLLSQEKYRVLNSGRLELSDKAHVAKDVHSRPIISFAQIVDITWLTCWCQWPCTSYLSPTTTCSLSIVG